MLRFSSRDWRRWHVQHVEDCALLACVSSWGSGAAGDGAGAASGLSPPAWSPPAGQQEGETKVSGTDPAPRGRETPGSGGEWSRGSSSKVSAGVAPAKLPPPPRLGPKPPC